MWNIFIHSPAVTEVWTTHSEEGIRLAVCRSVGSRSVSQTQDLSVGNSFSLVISRLQLHYFLLMIQHMGLILDPSSWDLIILLCVISEIVFSWSQIYCAVILGQWLIQRCPRISLLAFNYYYCSDAPVCYPGKIRCHVTRKLLISLYVKSNNMSKMLIQDNRFYERHKNNLEEIVHEVLILR